MSALISYARPANLTSWIDELFGDSVFSLLDRDITSTSWPRMDITEDKDAYHIKADLPGLEKGDISVSVENGVLQISGEKKEEKKDHEKGRFYHYERTYGKFSRALNLPDNADESSIDAEYKNGVLDLSIKKSEKARPKAIEVKVN